MKLPGTLAVPKGAGPFPAVLLVQDFGPKDATIRMASSALHTSDGRPRAAW